MVYQGRGGLMASCLISGSAATFYPTHHQCVLSCSSWMATSLNGNMLHVVKGSLLQHVCLSGQNTGFLANKTLFNLDTLF